MTTPPRPNGTDHGSRTPVSSEPAPNSTHQAKTGPTGQKKKSVRGRVSSDRPILDGRTDTRGLVKGDERERLAAGFGMELQRTREASGLTIPRTADLAGVGDRHLRYLEAGERRPSVDAIKALARVLAPASRRDWLEKRLAAAAGDSIREGNQRKKRREENSQRREAVQDLSKHHRKVTRMIAEAERAGRPVPEALRRLATSPAITDRINDQIVADEPGIRGVEVPHGPFDHLRNPQAYMKARIAEIVRTTK